MKKTKIIFVILLVFILIILGLSFKKPIYTTKDITWGVTFSKQYSEFLGIDWEETYLAILDEIKPTIIRLPVYWTDVEKKEGVLNFEDYDFIMNEADKRGIGITIVVGKRLPRWPECHVPKWASGMSKENIQKRANKIVIETVERYKNLNNLKAWQVENEPFLPFFGECPPVDAKGLDEEIKIVKFLDPNRPIIVTDSGELSIWLRAVKRADIFGTTMYRIVWSEKFSKYIGYIKYPLPPKFFWFKANVSRIFYGNKPMVVSELQAEPWGDTSSKMTREEQEKTMSIKHFNDNIEYARKVGFSEVYLWGAEWWYLMKTQQNQPEFWETAKKVMGENVATESN
jgi:hypothetical protein